MKNLVNTGVLHIVGIKRHSAFGRRFDLTNPKLWSHCKILHASTKL